MLRQLCFPGQIDRAKLQANHGRLGCTTSVPMLLRLFSLVAAAISYGCELWSHNCRAGCMQMPGSCRVCSLPSCAMSMVACLLVVLCLPVAQDPCNLSW